jgi:hypothetical protein
MRGLERHYILPRFMSFSFEHLKYKTGCILLFDLRATITLLAGIEPGLWFGGLDMSKILILLLASLILVPPTGFEPVTNGL